MTAKTRKTPASSKAETAEATTCIVEGCQDQEFEPGAGLCNPHFTTRLDLREVARRG